MNYKCPCCGFYTFSEPIGGTYDICPVCFWEDAFYSYDNPDRICGCNHVSLAQARKNFSAFGACTELMKKHVRPPMDSEKSGID